MGKRRSVAASLGALLCVGSLVGCSPTKGAERDADPAPAVEEAPAGTATPVTFAAKEYGFAVADTVPGGLVELRLSNGGEEAHFAGLARILEGGTFDQVKAILAGTAATGGAPSGPPPFEEFAGVATTEPGEASSVRFNLPAGSYALFCALPTSDGSNHAAKGMVQPLTVAEGRDGALPDSVATVTAVDFGLQGAPILTDGIHVVRLRNEGEQIHEINLVELAEGATMEQVVAWHRQPAGPPPVRYLGGAAVRPGLEATTRLNMKPGTTYAFICAIPDSHGDFAPHVTKGMYAPAFQT